MEVSKKSCVPFSGPGNTADDLTQHEYVYGPEYVDEFVLQSYRDTGGVQKPLYMLQDGNYNVMVLLDDTGAVVEQYQWEPYGSLATLDTTASPRPDNSVGHQGLFFYRFDSGDTLSLNALGLYYNRNRWFSPGLGRFLQADPADTGSTPLLGMTFHGQMCSCEHGCFDPSGHYAFGLNLYEYACSRSVSVLDPTGLFSVTSFVKRADKSLPFTLGSFLGSMIAAQQLEPQAATAFKFAKFAGGWVAKKTIVPYSGTSVHFARMFWGLGGFML